MKIACIGYGGHSKVIINIIKKIHNNAEIFIYDDVEKKIDGLTYLGKIKDINNLVVDYFVCCIGNLNIRKIIIQKKLNWLTLIDPSAVISSDVKIGNGTVIMAGVICQTNCIIGDNCIINTNSSIDHECNISNNVHIAPGSTLCGNVIIGENTFIGAGSTIINNVIIGNNNIIGAGSLVLKKDFLKQNNYTAYGTPCKLHQ